MKTVTIVLPDPIIQLLEAEARRQDLDPTALCSSLVAEHFLLKTRSVPMSSFDEVRASTISESRDEEGRNMFDVKKYFLNYPERSIKLAQQFVDEALKIPGVRARPNERGVGLEPNFAWIEYLHKQYPGAVGLSFYGSPSSLRNPKLKPGRTSSYSRAIARNQEELGALLDVLRQSYWLKMGHGPKATDSLS